MDTRVTFPLPPRRHAGLSLIELLVALAVGMVLTLAVTSIALSSSRAQNELSKSSQQVDNGRYALQMLAREIELAGFYGELMEAPAAPAVLPDPCDPAGADLRTALGVPIQAFDGATSTIPACVQAAGHVAGTDVLVLRRGSTQPATVLNANDLYLQSRAAALQVGRPGDLAGGADWVAFPIRLIRNDIYFIGETANGPALRRLQLTNGAIDSAGAMTLVDNIENMQLDFGVDRNGDGAPNAVGVAAAYVALPEDDEWPDVMTVRAHVLARAPEPTPGFQDEKSYALGLQADGTANIVPADGAAFKRHVYTATVRAVNRAGRRE
jgi:type IV pilus assembly protein PilW